MPLPNVQCDAEIFGHRCMYKNDHENPNNMIGSVTPLYFHRTEFTVEGKKTVIEWAV